MANFVSSRVPYGAHVIIIFVLSVSTLVLVILNTFSSPFINSIAFLRLPSPSGTTTFGSFGWCSPDFCLPNKVAYEYGFEVNKSLTGAMVLWPVSIIFTFFTVLAILPLLFVHESRALRYVGNRTFFVFSLFLAWLTVTVAWLLSIYGWSIARRAFQEAGTPASLGPAIWIGLAAWIAITIVAIFGWPAEAWDGIAAKGRTVPANGYYHYKRSTRQVVPR